MPVSSVGRSTGRSPSNGCEMSGAIPTCPLNALVLASKLPPIVSGQSTETWALMTRSFVCPASAASCARAGRGSRQTPTKTVIQVDMIFWLAISASPFSVQLVNLPNGHHARRRPSVKRRDGVVPRERAARREERNGETAKTAERGGAPGGGGGRGRRPAAINA